MADVVNKTVEVSADTSKAELQINKLAASMEDLNKASSDDKKVTILARMAKEAKAAEKSLTGVTEELQKQSTGLTRGATGYGARGNDARDFARQAQGLGGLVHVYAAVAANVYATSEAFNALSKAMDVVIMKQSMDLFAASTGVNVRTLTDEVMRLTDQALKLPDATRLVNLGVGAGIAGDQLKQLAVIAKGASAALGRDLNDSMDRLVRGIAKIEPELLDELGITIRAGQAYEMYAKSIGAVADELTGYQRMQAYTNAVIGQGLEKFEAIAEQVEVNAFTKLAAQIKNTTDAALGFVGTGLTPMINGLLEIPGAVQGLMALAGVKLAQLAMPALTSFKENALKEAQDLANKTNQIRLSAEAATNAMIASQRSISSTALAKIDVLNSTQIKENTEDLITHSTRLFGANSKITKELVSQLETSGSLAGKEELRASLIEKAQARQLAAATKIAQLEQQGVTSSAALSKAQQQERSAKATLARLQDLQEAETQINSLMREREKVEASITQLQSGTLNNSQKLVQLEAQRKQLVAEQKATLLAIGDTYGRMSKQASDYYSYMQMTSAAYAKERQEITNSAIGSVSVFGRTLSERVTAASTAITALATTAKGAMTSVGNFVLGPWGALISIAAIAFDPLARWAGIINEFSDEVTSAQENLERFGKSSATYLDKVTAALANTTRGSEKFGQIVDQVSKNVDSMTDAINRQFEAMEKYKKEYEGSNWFQKAFMTRPEDLDVSGIVSGFADIFEKIKTTGLGKTKATSIIAEALGIKASQKALQDLVLELDTLTKAKGNLEAKAAFGISSAERAEAQASLERLAALQKQIQSLPDLADKLKEAQRASVALLVDVEKSTQAIGKALDNADSFAPILESNLKKLQDPVNTLTEDARQMIGVINQFDRTKSASALEAMLVNVNRLTEQTIPGVTELISHLSKSQAFQVSESGKDYGQEALDRINAQVLATNELMRNIAAADQRLKDMKSDSRSPLKFIENAEQNLSSLIEQLKLLLAGTYGVATGALAGAASTKGAFPKPPKGKEGKSALDVELELKRSSLELDRQAVTLLKDRIDLNAKLGITSEADLYTQYEKAAISRNVRDYELDLVEIQKKSKDMPKAAAENYRQIASEQAKTSLELKNQQASLQAQELSAQNMYNAAKNRLSAEADVLRILDESYALQSKFGIGDSSLQVQNKVAQEINKLEAQRVASYGKIDAIQQRLSNGNKVVTDETITRLRTEERLLDVVEEQIKLTDKLLTLQLSYEISTERASKSISLLNDSLTLANEGYLAVSAITSTIKDTEEKALKAFKDRIALVGLDESLSYEEKKLTILQLQAAESKRRFELELQVAKLRSKSNNLSTLGEDFGTILEGKYAEFLGQYKGLAESAAEGVAASIDEGVNTLFDRIRAGEGFNVSAVAGAIATTMENAAYDFMEGQVKSLMYQLLGIGDPIKMQELNLLQQIAINTGSAAAAGSASSSSGFLGGIFGSAFGGSGGFNWTDAGASQAQALGMSYWAKGGAFNTSGVEKFAKGGTFTNSIVSEPTFMKFAKGDGFNLGQIGEAGPEAVMPLRRDSQGNLGVINTGGGANVVVNVINKAEGTEAKTTETRNADGSRSIEVVIEKAVETGLFNGRFDKALSSNFGMNRRAR